MLVEVTILKILISLISIFTPLQLTNYLSSIASCFSLPLIIRWWGFPSKNPSFGVYSPTVLNPAPADVKISKFLECVDYLIPNETEYELLKQTIPNSTRLIITLGEKGYEYIFNKETFKGEAPKVNVVDTTGAGDCFVGAFVSMLAKEKDINKETLDIVTKIASLSTTRPGSSVSSPSSDEVKDIL